MSCRQFISILDYSQSTAGSLGDPGAATAVAEKITGEIKPLGGRELYSAKQFSSEATHKIRIRYFPGISTKMRVRDLFTGEEYDIQYIQNEEFQYRWLSLFCKTTGAVLTPALGTPEASS